MLKILADANGLIIRPPFAPAAACRHARSGADAALTGAAMQRQPRPWFPNREQIH